MSGKASPEKLAIRLLKDHGFCVDIVERRNRYVSHDLFGCLDLFAMRKKDRRVMGIQVTSRSNRSSRIKKIMHTEHIADTMLVWLSCGLELEVWCWDKYEGRHRLGRDVFSLDEKRTGFKVARRDTGFH